MRERAKGQSQASNPPAHEFVKAVRRVLGFTQDKLAERLGADRSTVGKWEMEGGDEPSFPYVYRMFLLLGVVTPDTKNLRPTSGNHVQSPPMSNIEAKLLSELRRLPDDAQLEVYAHVIRLAAKHEEAASSQQTAALKKG